MYQQLITLQQLEKSPRNARRTVAKGASASLKASILAHGLMQNLVVTACGDGLYRVIEGARRLEALKALQAEGKLPEGFAAPCQIVSEEQAFEKSLAANTVRLAMHPSDEFEAYARLVDEGSSIEAIAERFGVDSKHVLQRLKLGRIAPALMAAYRAGELPLDALMAFTLTDDHGRQMSVWNGLQGWQQSDARAIRALLTQELASAGSKLARFVGLDTYRAAGGTLRSDLFGEETYLENPELLQALASEKLRLAAQRVEAEGWGWVEVSQERDWQLVSGCGRIHPQPAEVPQELEARRESIQAELEELQLTLEDTESDTLIEAFEEAEERLFSIEAEIDALAAFEPEAMARAGCYITIGHDGSLSIDRGLVRKTDLRKTPASDDASPDQPRKAMPETLRRDLESYRLQAAQVEVASHPQIALDVLIFTLSSAALATPLSTGPEMRLVQHYPTDTVRREPTKASEALEAIRQSLPLAFLQQTGEAERFRAFLALTQEEKLRLLAWCVAHSLRPQLSTGRETTAIEAALSLTVGDVASYFRPTAANFLGRITRDGLLELAKELLGDQWANARSKDKKGELVAALERCFEEPEKPGRTPDQIKALRAWLPPGMAFCPCVSTEAEATTHATEEAA